MNFIHRWLRRKCFMGKCKIWRHGRCNGYGWAYKDGKEDYAHRFAWESANGPIPNGLFILHKCDVRLCVNPKHLYAGTLQDNTRDAVERNRFAKGKNHGLNIHPESRLYGSRNPSARFSQDTAEEIRRLYKSGLYQQRELAKKYKAGVATIFRIVSGESYKTINTLQELAYPIPGSEGSR